MPRLQPKQPPPPDYYADRLQQLLDHVVSTYGDIASPELIDLEVVYSQLSSRARRLFVRLVMRKGPWFRSDRLNYREVDNLPEAVAELIESKLVLNNPEGPWEELLQLLLRGELEAMLISAAFSTRQMNKQGLIDSTIAFFTDAELQEKVSQTVAVLRLECHGAIGLAQLLFFGDSHQNLSTFVMEDLGLRRYEPIAISERRFKSARALQRYLELRVAEEACAQLPEDPSMAAALKQQAQPAPESRHEQRSRNRILNRLGRWHERQQDYNEALDCFSRSTAAPARERQVRILRRIGETDSARKLLNSMALAPWSADEQEFTRRACKHPEKYPTQITSLHLSQPSEGSIEQLALHQLTNGGGRGWHVENRFPLGLAGLIYWSAVFDPLPGVFTNPYQAGPLDLFWPDFYQARRSGIEGIESALVQDDAFIHALATTLEIKHGTVNRLVDWTLWQPEFLDALCECMPVCALRQLAAFVIQHLHWTRSGFPDLILLYSPGCFEFVEVKSPTDRLQNGQRVWLRQLNELSLPGRVLQYRAPRC